MNRKVPLVDRVAWVLEIFRRYRDEYSVFLAGQIASHLLALVTPFASMAIIDRVVASGSQASLISLVAIIAAANVLSVLLNFSNSGLFATVGFSITNDIAMQVNQRLLSLPLSYFQKSAVADNIARVNEIDKIRGFIDTWILSRGVELIFALFYLCVMLWMAPTLSLIALSVIPIHAVVYAIFNSPTRQAVQQQFDASRDYHGRLIASLDGIETVKTFRGEARFHRSLQRDFGRYIGTLRHLSGLGRRTGLLTGISSIAIDSASLLVGIRGVIDGSMTLGALFAFQLIASRAVAPLQASTGIVQQITEVENAVNRLGEIVDHPLVPYDEFDGKRAASDAVKSIQEICLKEVAVDYQSQSRRRALNDITMRILPSEHIAIIGPSGAGKSTLGRVLANLVECSHGSVELLMSDARAIDKQRWREHILYLPQHCTLFSGTLLDNLTLFATEFDRVQAREAADAACIADICPANADPLEFTIEEGGRNLSGGQRQRIAIARAILHEPKILILNEATSALDVELERHVIQNMRSLFRNSVLIVITHRIELAKCFSRVVMLDSGSIAFDGNLDDDRLHNQRLHDFLEPPKITKLEVLA